MPNTRAPYGDLSSYERDHFVDGAIGHDVYRKGRGPAALVITELPGIAPAVLGFADRLVALGCTAIVPDLFGEAGRDADAENALARTWYLARTFVSVCVRREFSGLATGGTLPVTRWLRALAKREHERCGGPGVGVVGMCFAGGFALAMAADPRVLAPVLSQPSLPLPLTRRARATVDCDAAELDQVAERCSKEGLRVLGLRFHEDPLVPAERFAFLRQRLGTGFISVELPQSVGNPDSLMRKHHSVLTRDLIDEPGEATRSALEQVLSLFRAKLLATDASVQTPG